jgi:TRAP-type mannitol/chloroaromatic compound transport system substrate-binding protein
MSDARKNTKQAVASVPTRRKFFKRATAGAAGGAALLAFPMISKAQSPIKLRMQSPFAPKDFFDGVVNQVIKTTEEMAGGRLKIEKLPPNSVVKTFDMMEAVHKGLLDGCFGAGSDGRVAPPQLVLCWRRQSFL